MLTTLEQRHLKKIHHRVEVDPDNPGRFLVHLRLPWAHFRVLRRLLQPGRSAVPQATVREPPRGNASEGVRRRHRGRTSR